MIRNETAKARRAFYPAIGTGLAGLLTLALVACDASPAPADTSVAVTATQPTAEPMPTPTLVPRPTATLAPSATPIPVRTATSTPTATSVPASQPAPEYPSEEIPPCTPVPGSSVDPCEPGVQWPWATESDGLLLAVPPLWVHEFLNNTVATYTSHVALRGTYLSDTVRCASGHRNQFPSYTGNNLDALSIYCFADVRVNAYLLGVGPSNLTVIVESNAYAILGDDDDDYGLEQLESRRLAFERALVEGGRFEYDFPVHRGHVPPAKAVASGPPGGIGGREVIMFLGPSDNLYVEAWKVNHTWDVERREDDTVVAIHPYRRSFYSDVDISALEMELPALKQEVTTAHEARVAANGGRIGEDMSLPMLETDANRLRHYFSDPKVGAYAPGAPTPAQPPPPCGLAVPNQTDNPGLMRECQALLAAKDTLRGTATLNWSVDTAITGWDGVTVGGIPSHVTVLDIESEGLTGSVPPELSRLTGLEELRLSGNSFTGCIPDDLREIPTNDLSSLGLPFCGS